MVQDTAQASATSGKRSASNKLSTSPSKRKTPESLRSSAASFNSSIKEISFPQQNPQSTTSKPIVTYSARDRKRTRSGNDGRPDQFDNQTSLRKRAASNDSPARTLPQTLNIKASTSDASSTTTRVKRSDDKSGKEVKAKENSIPTNRQSGPPSSTRRKRSDSSFILEIDSNAYSSHRSKAKSIGTEAKAKRKEETPVVSTNATSPASVNEHDRESNSSGNDENDATADKPRFERETGGRSPESDSDKQKPNSSLPIPSTSQATPSTGQQLPTPSPDVDIKPFESSPKLPIFATVSRPRLSRLSQAELNRRAKVDAGEQNANKLAPTKDKLIDASTQVAPSSTSAQPSNGAAPPSAASPALVESPSLASHLLSFDPDFIFATRDSSIDIHLDFLAPLFSQLHYDTVPKLRRLKPRDSSLVIRKLKLKYEEGGMKEGIVEDLDWERMEERLRDGFGRG